MVARIALGAKCYVAVEALRGEMAWSTYRDRISRMKANYKGKLIQSRIESWPGYIHRYRWASGWRKELRRIDKRYNLENAYHQNNYKETIKRMIIGKSQEEWEEGIRKKSTLQMYSNKKRPAMEKFYDGSWGSKLLFGARTGSLEINGRTHHWNETGENCHFCPAQVKETVEHLIVECEGHRLERQEFIEEIVDRIGAEEWRKKSEEDDSGLLLLLGFEADERLVECTKKYLVKVMKKREV